MCNNYNFEEIETEAVVELVNNLARGIEHTDLPPDFWDIDNEDDRSRLVGRLYSECMDLSDNLEDNSTLSGNESHIVALKTLGLTHNGIAELVSMDSEGIKKSTVDEMSRRAKQKYHRAVQTAELLEPVYGGDEK